MTMLMTLKVKDRETDNLLSKNCKANSANKVHQLRNFQIKLIKRVTEKPILLIIRKITQEAQGQFLMIKM